MVEEGRDEAQNRENSSSERLLSVAQRFGQLSVIFAGSSLDEAKRARYSAKCGSRMPKKREEKEIYARYCCKL